MEAQGLKLYSHERPVLEPKKKLLVNESQLGLAQPEAPELHRRGLPADDLLSVSVQ